jgi:hypothetical protein
MAFKFNPFTGNFDDVADVAEKVSGPASSTDNAIARFDGTGGITLQNSGVTIDDSDNVIIPGNLTVNGTTTTVNSATLDVADSNITVNDGGNDASAEGAGLTVERTGTDGSFIYEDALTSKFKIGALGSEVEVADISSSQTLTNKTIDADNNTIVDIANANISATAAIEYTKLEALTADRVTITNGSGFQTVSAVTSTELGFLSGVGSNVQTQLDAKLDDFTSTTDNALMRSNGITGEAVQDSGVILDDTDAMTGLQSLTFNSGVLISSFLDEDDLASDSDTAVPTQQSVKAYVDSSVAAGVYDVNSISTDTNAAANQTYLVDVTGGTVEVTLPSPTLNTFVRIKDSEGNSTANNITVSPNAAETIDGNASYTLDSDFESKVFVSDGTNWFVF